MAKLTKSPRYNFLLGQMGIFTNYAVVYHIPKRYDDFSLTREKELEDKERVVIYGRLASLPRLVRARNIQLVTFDFLTEKKTYFKIVAFNRPYLTKLKMDTDYTIIGSYVKKQKGKTFTIDMLADWGNKQMVIEDKSKCTLNMHGHMYNRGLTDYKNDGEVICIHDYARVTINGGTGPEAELEHKNINTYESRLSNIKSHNGYFSHISYIESISSNYTLKEFEDELTALLERKFYYNYFDTSIFIVLIKKNSQVIIIIGDDYKKHLKHDVRIPVFREYIKYELKLGSIDYVFDYTSKQLEKSFDFFDPNIVPGRNYLFAVISLSIIVGICIIFFIITFICLFCSNKCKIENNREYAKNAKTLF